MGERRPRLILWVVPVVLALGYGCRQGSTDVHAAVPPARPAVAASGAAPSGALPADDGQWLIPAKDYASTRFSALDEIRSTNVGGLKLAWTFSTGVARGHEGAPLVVNGTMYLVTPYSPQSPNVLYALDLTQPGAPAKWSYRPKVLQAAQGVACCDVVNRGASYAQGRVFYNTLDGQTIAVDAGTGQAAWVTQVADINKGESLTMAPLVVKDKVLVGNSGG